MIKSLPLFFLLIILSTISLAQTNTERIKECRIAAGFGMASATENVKSVGTDFWIQLNYRVLENISIATEFEVMNYRQHGYFVSVPIGPNEINVYDNNFSLLAKYHFSTANKIKLSLASGWTYTIRQSAYYNYHIDGNTQSWSYDVTSFSDYRIPFLLEIGYGLSKKLDIQARVKYNLNGQNGDTYSSGLGISLQL